MLAEKSFEQLCTVREQALISILLAEFFGYLPLN